jgi:hypothetical protein
VDVAEVVDHVRLVPADVLVERLGEPVGEQLRPLGGDVADVGRGAGGDEGQDLREEVAPVGALDGLHPHRDVRVRATERGDQAATRLGVLRGAEDGDVEGVGVAPRDVVRGQPLPGDRGADRAERGQAQQAATGEIRHGGSRSSWGVDRATSISLVTTRSGRPGRNH